MSYRENAFRSQTTTRILNKMVGKLKPSEILHLVKDRELRDSDVPEWIERLLRRECRVLIARLRRYEDRIRDRYGFLGSVIEKLAIYSTIWSNWDGNEPFPWTEEKKLEAYFDSNQPQ